MAINPHVGEYPAPSDYYQIRRIDYPESDGEPMAETEAHGETLEDIRSALKRRYVADPQVQVGGNCFMYYVEGDPKRCVSPDVYVIFGVSKGARRVLKLWEEGKAPDVVIEVTSSSTRLDDVGTKKGLYAALGVREYVLFDPFADYLEPPLQGFRLVDDTYVPIEPREGALESEVLGLVMTRVEGEAPTLAFVDAATGEAVRSATAQVAWEAARAEQEAARAEQEAARAEQEAARAEQEAARAEQEAEARRALEARVAALEARLGSDRDS